MIENHTIIKLCSIILCLNLYLRLGEKGGGCAARRLLLGKSLVKMNSKAILFAQQGILILKKKRLHICLLIVLALTFHIQGVSIAAESSTGKQDADNTSQPLKLSLEAAVKKGVANNAGLISMDISIKKMWRVTNEDKSFKELTTNTQENLDKLDEYYKLSERKSLYENLTNYEESQVLEYQKEYGAIPPSYPRQDLYEGYLNGKVFSIYSSWLQILRLKDTYDTSKAKLEGDIQNMYYNLLYDTELYESLESSLNTMEKQYSGIVLKYQKGMLSELDKYQFEVARDKKKLELNRQKRNKELRELLFRQLCGIDRSQPVELTSKDAGLNKDIKLDTYDSYYNKAVENRSEIVNARLQLEVYKQELEYYDKYIRKKYVFARANLQQQLEDAEFALTQKILDITGDIQTAYTDVKSVKSQMEIQKRNAQSKISDYNISEKKYLQGQISLIDLLNAKNAASNAEIEYKKAQRILDYSYYRLELASRLGPGYR